MSDDEPVGVPAANPYEGVMFPVKAEVVGASGEGCRARHAAGETWLMRGVPAGVCSFAFNAMFPIYWTLRFGGSDPRGPDPDRMNARCSVSDCGAVFRLSRIQQAEADRINAETRMLPLTSVEVVDHGGEREG